MADTITFWLALPVTVALYALVRALYQTWRWPIINPVLLPTGLIIAGLLYFELPLAQYQQGTQWLNAFLEPAVVALALPLYWQKAQIRAHIKPITLCLALAVVISMSSAWLLGMLFDAPKTLQLALATRSITTPLAMSVNQTYGGVAEIAAAIVVVVGISGALIGYPFLKLIGVHSPHAQGLAMGACAHAIGTAASAEQGAIQGAFASLAMILCAVLTAALMPLLLVIHAYVASFG
ncbi:MAG: LrgB family protein [Vibrionaceae bacterium]